VCESICVRACVGVYVCVSLRASSYFDGRRAIAGVYVLGVSVYVCECGCLSVLLCVCV